MSIISIAQQIEELRLELAHCDLTRSERREAIAELEWLKERQRIEEEQSAFAWIEQEIERHPPTSEVLDRLPF